MGAAFGAYVALLLWLGRQSVDWPLWAYLLLLIGGVVVVTLLRAWDRIEIEKVLRPTRVAVGSDGDPR